jgi:hypothetical protein
MDVALQIIDSFTRGTFPDKLMYWPDGQMCRSSWDKTIAAAEEYNEPGRFTAFIDYEWTSQVPPGQNLHRRGGTLSPSAPVSSFADSRLSRTSPGG